MNGSLLSTASSDLKTGMNIVYNDTATRLAEFIVTGNYDSEGDREIEMLGIQCLGNCVEEVETVEIDSEYVFWSDPDSWPSGSVPAEGEDVTIEPGVNMLLDVEEPPIFNFVKIQGRLTFNPDHPCHLQAYQVFVQGGELYVGTPEAPYT